MLDNLREQAVRGRKGTNSDSSSSLLALWNSMKELPKIIQSGSPQDRIERAGENLKHWYPNNLADDLWIDQNHMPLNSRLKDNATVLILHNLQMNVELSDQSGEYDVGAIVEVAPVICLYDLIDNITPLTTFRSRMTGLLAILALEAALPSSVICWTLR
jgi:hypothetical protein